jgi:hypothetical protein
VVARRPSRVGHPAQSISRAACERQSKIVTVEVECPNDSSSRRQSFGVRERLLKIVTVQWGLNKVLILEQNTGFKVEQSFFLRVGPVLFIQLI